ncbi:hypothetical protein HFP67_23660 [Bacillus sp. CB102A.1]
MPKLNIVIACISGRGGVSSPSGITALRDDLRNKLAPLGVDPDSIFRRSWNKNADDDPFGYPWVTDLNAEINQRSTNPDYLALIGHSYGGWAACRLSRKTNRTPDFIALLDPFLELEIVWDQKTFLEDYPLQIGIKIIALFLVTFVLK